MAILESCHRFSVVGCEHKQHIHFSCNHCWGPDSSNFLCYRCFVNHPGSCSTVMVSFCYPFIKAEEV